MRKTVPAKASYCSSPSRVLVSAPSWVAAQTLDIRKRELDAEVEEYEERLAKARKTEAHFRMLARARVTKKQ